MGLALLVALVVVLAPRRAGAAVAPPASIAGGGAGWPGRGWLQRGWRWFGWVAFWGLVAGVAVLAATALYGVLVAGGLHGWPLLAHVLTGGAALVALAGFALAFARARTRGRGSADRSDRPHAGVGGGTFALVLVAGAMAGGSMLASSLPLVGTDGLLALLDIHRWSGLALALVTLLMAARALRRRR